MMSLAPAGALSAQEPESWEIHLVPGWNLLSVPVAPADPAREAVFPPDLVSAVWAWNDGYHVPQEIAPKRGYWIRALEARTLLVTGPRPHDTAVDLTPGWNLVGPVGPSSDRPRQSPPPNPPCDAVWEYDGGYGPPGDCCPDGRGYWIHAAEAATIWRRIHIDEVQIVAPDDPAAVPRYDKVELAVTLSAVSATKPYDPDPDAGGLDLAARFTGPGGAVRDVHGFYDGSTWRVRFAPDATGAWEYSVTAEDVSGRSNAATGSFTCVISGHPGFARIDGHSLRFSEGPVLFAVGHNTGWQYDAEQPSAADMAARDENLLSFWLVVPWAERAWTSPSEPWWDDRAPIENVEQGLGNYNQEACAYIDGVLERAEDAGICVLPTLWSHGQLRDADHWWGEGWWYNNAYNTICAARDFFRMTDAGGADTPQWRHQKNLYRYVIARWGYSRALAGWVAVCEMEGTTGYYRNRAQAETWCAAVRDYFGAHDPFRSNDSDEYPLTVSKVDDPSWDVGLHLRATDSYAGQYNDVAVAGTIATQTQTMRAAGRPCFHAEFGGDVLHGASQPGHLHNGIWAGLSTGAAMTPLVWCDGGNFPMLTSAMRDHLEHLSRFAAQIDYLDDPTLAAASPTVSDPQCRAWGMRLADRGFAWVQDTAGLVGGETLTVAGLTPGDYRVAWYDVWTSGDTPIQIDEPVVVDGDGVLSIVLPAPGRADVACRFERTAPP